MGKIAKLFFWRLLGAPGRSPVRPQQGFEVAADPRRHGAFAMDRPGQHRAAVDVLDQTSELCRITPSKLAGRNSLAEKFSSLLTDSAELRKSDGVKVRVNQVDLEVGEAIGHGFRSGREGGAFRIQLDERFERRFVLGARGCKLLGYT